MSCLRSGTSTNLAPPPGESKSLALAWAAGFFDGEGCIYVGRNAGRRQRHLPRISVGNTGLRPLERLHALLGGSLHPRRRTKGERRPVWQWEISGARGCADALTLLLPYLVEKRPQAEVMLELCARFDQPGVRISDTEHAARSALADRLAALKRETLFA